MILREDDPRVVAARLAEQRLFANYKLETNTRFLRTARFGIRIRIIEVGHGRPVLMVPGNTGDVFPLASLLAELKGWRVIAINRPGGGLSDGIDHRRVDFRELALDTLTSVLDAYALGSAPIIAHSIGGHWSLWLALDRPERVEALALLGVPGNIMDASPPLALRLMSVPVLNGLIFDLISLRSSGQPLRGLAFMGHSKETCSKQPKALAECYRCFQALPHYRVASLSLMERANRLRGAKPGVKIEASQLNQIGQPTLLLWGENDPFGSVETGRMISKEIPHAELHVIASGGHLPWLDGPQECGRAINEFFQKRLSPP